MLVDRVLDRKLECHGRRRAAVAAALEPQARSPVVDAKQVDAAAVRLEIGTHLVERGSYPRLERDRVQPVQDEELRDELVATQGVGELAPVLALRQPVHDPREPLAVEVEQRGHHLGGLLTRPGVGERVDLLEEALDARHLLAGLAVVHRPG